MFQLSGFYHSNMQQQALPCHHTLRFKVEGCALSLQLTPAAQFGNGRQQGEGDAAKGQGHRTQVGGLGSAGIQRSESPFGRIGDDIPLWSHCSHTIMDLNPVRIRWVCRVPGL